MYRRHGLIWYIPEAAAWPWWLGAIRPFEFSIEATIIPFNLLVGWWHFIMAGIRWKLLPRSVRVSRHRRALVHSFERGRASGFIEGDQYARQAMGRFAEQHLAEVRRANGEGANTA